MYFYVCVYTCVCVYFCVCVYTCTSVFRMCRLTRCGIIAFYPLPIPNAHHISRCLPSCYYRMGLYDTVQHNAQESAVLYVRDRKEAAKVLTAEERDVLEKQAKSMRSSQSGYVYKEKKLTIKGGGPKVGSVSSAGTGSNTTSPLVDSPGEDASGAASASSTA